MTGWRDLTPAEVLAQLVVLDATQVAYVLGLTIGRGRHAGEPDHRQVVPLVNTGRLHPIDPTLVPRRWRFSTASVQRYLDQLPGAKPGPVHGLQIGEVA